MLHLDSGTAIHTSFTPNRSSHPVSQYLVRQMTFNEVPNKCFPISSKIHCN